MANKEMLQFSSYREANKYFDDVVEKYFKERKDTGNNNTTDIVEFLLALGSMFTAAGQTYLAKASIGAAKTYMEGCS